MYFVEDIAANDQYILMVKAEDKLNMEIIIGVYNKSMRLTNKEPVQEENKIFIYKVIYVYCDVILRKLKIINQQYFTVNDLIACVLFRLGIRRIGIQPFRLEPGC